MNDILLIDKPKGITSFDVIRILRKKLGVRKMGHAGTLDPMATGLMIIGVESGTKKLKDYIGLDKIYKAEILLGIKTDTGDLDGQITEERKIPKLSETEIETTLNDLVGEINLPVPKYSAVKIKGKPLYKYAREGNEISVPVKTMKINWVKDITYDNRVINVTMNVSSGTYIRSIAEDVGKKLNSAATLQNLRRLEIGKFTISNAKRLTEF